MILFTRTLTVLGNPLETGGWARRMAKLVTEKTGKETALWAGLSGTAPGAHIFSAFFQNMADFLTATETLAGDKQYLDGVGEGRQHLVGPPEDRHVEILHTAGGEYQRPGLGGVVQLTTATPAPGKLNAAIGWGVQIAELVSEIIGEPVFFGHSVAGPFGELAWIGASADASAWDRTQEALNKDARYLASLDEGTPNFEVGSGRVILARRIA
jgi:hypothetical protein